MTALLPQLLAILGLAAACGAWVLVQRRSGRDLHVCDGAGRADCKGRATGSCEGCPHRSQRPPAQ